MDEIEKNLLKSTRRFLFLVLVLVVLASAFLGAGLDRRFGFSFLDEVFPRERLSSGTMVTRRVLNEESRVIETVQETSPSVVTVNFSKKQRVVDPFGAWGPWRGAREEKIEQDIGSGFVISDNGLIVTNRHVVDDPEASYRVITTEEETYEVEKIYRDPINDLAILKIGASGLKPLELGDSANLKVGQSVIAIGTALGEFRSTVTTGVISGLGRGITAGSPFEGYVERLDDVIQTDAAINPGNSGGPLLNSLGQVIGVSVAVASQGENIAFAIPINVIKESLSNFNETGKFSRPFLGVRYRMIGRDLALMNEVPQGAYLIEVIESSPADEAGLEAGDIITKFDGQPLAKEEAGLAGLINQHKVNDRITLEIWRDGETKEVGVVLKEFGD
jgi:S1-C subfamily serine protease